MSLQYVETRMGRALVTSAERRRERDRQRRRDGTTLPPRLKVYRRQDKAAILSALAEGTLSRETALSLYGLTAERLRAWRQAMPASGRGQR